MQGFRPAGETYIAVILSNFSLSTPLLIASCRMALATFSSTLMAFREFLSILNPPSTVFASGKNPGC